MRGFEPPTGNARTAVRSWLPGCGSAWLVPAYGVRFPPALVSLLVVLEADGSREYLNQWLALEVHVVANV